MENNIFDWTSMAPKPGTSQGYAPSQDPLKSQQLSQNPMPQDVMQMVIDAYAKRQAEDGSQPKNFMLDIPNMSEAIIVAGGLIVILHFVNKTIKATYFRAVSYLDLSVRHPGRYGGWRESFWRWAEVGLRRFWMPLWFDHQEIGEKAISENRKNCLLRMHQDQEFRELRDRQMAAQAPIYR